MIKSIEIIEFDVILLLNHAILVSTSIEIRWIIIETEWFDDKIIVLHAILVSNIMKIRWIINKMTWFLEIWWFFGPLSTKMTWNWKISDF